MTKDLAGIVEPGFAAIPVTSAEFLAKIKENLEAKLA